MSRKLQVMILTAEDSKKVFRLDEERLSAALARYPQVRELADFTFTRTSTSYEDAPGWSKGDHEIFYKDLVNKDVILGYFFPLEGFAARAPRLRYIHIIEAGVEHLMPLSWLPKGTLLTNSRGAHAPKTCEYAMVAMLMLGNHLPRLATTQREHRWDGHFLTLVEGRNALIIGCGKQGAAVARAAARLGVHATGIARKAEVKEGFERILPLDQLHQALGEADYVFLTLPSTPSTQRFFGREAFEAMKEGAGFINICRGKVLDTQALLWALESGKLSGAILDVFDEEPLPADSPLWEAKNLLLTPHMGCDDEENYIHRCFDIFFENLIRMHGGEPLENLVDPDKGY